MENYGICRPKYILKNDAIGTYWKYKSNSLGTFSNFKREIFADVSEKNRL